MPSKPPLPKAGDACARLVALGLATGYRLVGELLARFLALDGLYDEDAVNRRLAEVTDDVAGVRRMLVDTGWLERDRAGTTYGPGRPLPQPAHS